MITNHFPSTKKQKVIKPTIIKPLETTSSMWLTKVSESTPSNGIFYKSVAWGRDGALFTIGNRDADIKAAIIVSKYDYNAQVLSAFVSICVPSDVNSIAISPCGGKIAVAEGQDTEDSIGRISLWVAADSVWRSTQNFTVKNTSMVHSVAWSSHGGASKLAVGSHQHGEIGLWSDTPGQLLLAYETPSHNGENGCTCRFVGFDSRCIRDPACPVNGHSEWVNCVAFAPGAAVLASASADATVRLWAIDAAGSARPLHELDDSVPSDFQASGASGGADASLHRPASSATAVTFSDGGELLAAGFNNGRVRLWSPAAGGWHAGPAKERPALRHGQGVVRAVAFSPGGAVLATVADKSGPGPVSSMARFHFCCSAWLWSAGSGERLGILPDMDDVVSIAFQVLFTVQSCPARPAPFPPRYKRTQQRR
jgi:WD40 repeat protein